MRIQLKCPPGCPSTQGHKHYLYPKCKGGCGLTDEVSDHAHVEEMVYAVRGEDHGFHRIEFDGVIW